MPDERARPRDPPSTSGRMTNVSRAMPAYALGFLLALLLGGCATGYHPNGAGGGYSDRRLDTDVFYVSFRANSYTSRDAVERYAFYRCAEVTLQAGYDYFVVVGGNTDARKVFHAAGGSHHSTTPAVANGNAASAITFGTYVPGAVNPVRNNEATLLIKVVRGPRPPEQGVDARQVLKRIGPSIKKE
jgi:hypothetical protein